MVSLAPQDWTPAGHDPLPGWAWIAPLAFLLLALGALAHAYRTRARHRAPDALPPAEEERLRRAIEAAEHATSADIVPLVLERSDSHPETRLAGTLVFLSAANLALFGFASQASGPWLILAELLLATAGWLFTSAVPAWRRLFLSRARADELVREQALVELAQLAPGGSPTPLVLVLVSLFERRVVVLANDPATGGLRREPWPAVVEAVLGPTRQGRLADGLAAGLELAAREMRDAFPPAPTPPRRFADRVIVRRD